MKQRIFSTILLLSVLAGTLWLLGSVGAILLLAVLSLAAQAETYRLLEKMDAKPFRKAGFIAGTCLLLSSYYSPKWMHEADFMVVVLAAAVLLVSILILFDAGRKDPEKTVVPTLFGIIYVPFMLAFYIKIVSSFTTLTGNEQPGLLLAVWVMLSAKFCDMGALLVGKNFGRTKMAAMLSPKKTVEGAIGGIVIASLFSMIYIAVFNDRLPMAFPLWMAALLAVPIALTSILSDLFESYLKRHASVKDSGQLLPGIGGAMDLADSLLLTAPVGYFLLVAVF